MGSRRSRGRHAPNCKGIEPGPFDNLAEEFSNGQQARSVQRKDRLHADVRFDTAAVRSAFSDAAIAAVLEVHPDAFNETVAA